MADALNMNNNTTELNSNTCDLNCQSIVSAGAGTGKTYNIQILVLRKILAGTPIEKILVVTFTNLATEELQDRLRKVLQKALEFCAKFKATGKSSISEEDIAKLPPGEIDEYKQVSPCIKGLDLDTIIPYLQNALHDFDFASVSTIHGFCSRTLSDNAFESGLRYGLEMRKKSDALGKAILSQFYRNFTKDATEPNNNRCRLLKVLKITPDTLAKKLKDAISNPRVAINWGKVPGTDTPIEQLSLADLENLLAETENIWAELSNAPVEETESPQDKKGKGKSKSKEETPQDECKKLYKCLLLKRAYNYLVSGIQEAKKHDGFMTFNDLLVDLLERLQSDDAERLLELLRKKYDCILIDEYQDTDAVQSAIFKTIFGGLKDKMVFYIGDEKQAIYKFRGGDVQTFQKTKEDIAKDKQYTLSKNFRSSEEYIHAMNDVFNNGFFERKSCKNQEGNETVSEATTTPEATSSEGSLTITMPEIVPSDDGKERYLCDGNGNPLQDDMKKHLLSLCLLDSSSTSVAQEMAAEIKALHDSGYKFRKLKEENGVKEEVKKEIRYQDIAILVRSSTHVNEYREALKERGIPSVFLQGKSIFSTPEAAWLLSVMDAVISPGDQGLALSALANPVLGFSCQELAFLQQNCLADFQMFLKKCLELWNTKSFYFMFNEFLKKPLASIFPHLNKGNEDTQKGTIFSNDALSASFMRRITEMSLDGTHVLSIILQLSEMLMAVALEQHLGPGALRTFLHEKIQVQQNKKNSAFGSSDGENASVDEDDNDDELFPVHMTTQADAVRILTIHKSKGLEFPIVFVPQFISNGPSQFKECVFHVDGKRCINMDEDDKESQTKCDEEKLEEQRRLMYVAITRAGYLCRFISKGSTGKDDEETRQKTHPELFIQNRVSPEEWFLATTEACPSPAPASGIQEENFDLQSKDIHPGWVTTSFSSIAKGKKHDTDTQSQKDNGDSAENANSSEDTAETTDARGQSRITDDDQNEDSEKDDLSKNHSGESSPWTMIPFADRTPLFQFPGGTRTGTCWHEIFEKLDFTQWKQGTQETDENWMASWEQVEKQLQNYAQLGREKTRDERKNAFKEMLFRVCNTKLFNGEVQLYKIPLRRTLREFDFTYKIHEGITAEEIRELLSDAGISVPDEWSHNIGKQNLTGSIDLLFQQPENGKFYILDWKTNILDADAKSFTKENVKKEVDRRFYSFQCVIYVLAFVQYYRQRLHGINFTEDERSQYAEEALAKFGGCGDMLVRGMNGVNDDSVHYLEQNDKFKELILELDKKIGVCTMK